MLYVRSRLGWGWGSDDKTWMPVSQDRFPDGTLHMTAPKDSLFKDSDVDIYWKYNNDAELFSLICLRKHYADCKNVRLYMPYCPHTRDTFGIAVKATYAEDADGKPIMIYKQPKALSWKKSQKGCCRVALDGQSYEDELTWADHLGEDNLLQPVFRDGNMIKEDTLHDIRARLYKEGF